jgi:hypothetical protein
MMDLEQQVRQARFAYERRAGAARALAENGQRVQAEVDRLQADVERHQKVNALLTSLGEQAQQHAQDQLEQLVTRGLQVIFGTELSFHVVQSVKAGQASTDFMIRSSFEDGTVVETPVMEARGGGMAEVVGFMVQLVVLLLTPGARRIMFQDESFGFVSREYEPRVAEFLKEVTERAQVQVVLVTHSDAYDDAADVRYRMKPAKSGIAELERY